MIHHHQMLVLLLVLVLQPLIVTICLYWVFKLLINMVSHLSCNGKVRKDIFVYLNLFFANISIIKCVIYFYFILYSFQMVILTRRPHKLSRNDKMLVATHGRILLNPLVNFIDINFLVTVSFIFKI